MHRLAARNTLIVLALALLASAGTWHWVRGRSLCVATVARTQGEVTRDFAGHEERWKPAARGDALHVGDAAQTGSRATAALALRDGAMLSMKPDTVVRFSSKRPEAADFRLEAGEALLETSARSVAIETAFGLITVGGHAALRLQHQPTGMHLHVEMGRAIFVDPSGSSQTVLAGGELAFERDGAPRDQRAADATTPNLLGEAQPLLTATQAGEGAENSAHTGEAETDRERRSAGQRAALPTPPERADVSLPAGESATVHHPGAATSVRLGFGQRCRHGEGLVELATGRQRFRVRAVGRSEALIRLPRGETRYRVRCVAPGHKPGKVVARGRLRSLRDAAIRRVPLQPPSNAVDLDGRRYTLLYQNRLPALILRTPDGEPAERIVIQSGSRTRAVQGRGPSYRLASGELGDGRHQIHVERGGGARLPATTLNITFDNAAPMAHLDQRGVLDRDETGRVALSGVVPLGSRVSLGGRVIAVDGQGRFAVRVAPGPEETSVVLRVVHPRAGVHYYVRQLTEAGVE